MHMRTKALVLRAVDYKESDKILTLLTQESGKLTASARGCRKKGSPVAAGVQLLAWSDLVLYEYRGRWTVKEAAVEREFLGLRRDVERLALACYFAEAAEALAVEDVPAPELLSLVLNSLYALDQMPQKPLALVKAAFELRLMCAAGYEPILDGCAVCGAERPEEPRFHLREGALHCAKCRGGVGDLHAGLAPRPGRYAACGLRGRPAAVFLPAGQRGPGGAGRGERGVSAHPAGTGLPHPGLL